jgi:hypothetical protein
MAGTECSQVLRFLKHKSENSRDFSHGVDCQNVRDKMATKVTQNMESRGCHPNRTGIKEWVDTPIEIFFKFA